MGHPQASTKKDNTQAQDGTQHKERQKHRAQLFGQTLPMLAVEAGAALLAQIGEILHREQG